MFFICLFIYEVSITISRIIQTDNHTDKHRHTIQKQYIIIVPRCQQPVACSQPGSLVDSVDLFLVNGVVVAAGLVVV